MFLQIVPLISISAYIKMLPILEAISAFPSTSRIQALLSVILR